MLTNREKFLIALTITIVLFLDAFFMMVADILIWEEFDWLVTIGYFLPVIVGYAISEVYKAKCHTKRKK